MVKGEITMKNKKLLKYFTEKILPILDEIEFNDKEHASVLSRDVYEFLESQNRHVQIEVLEEMTGKKYE